MAKEEENLIHHMMSNLIQLDKCTMYVAEGRNKRVQVLDSSGHFLREFGVGKSQPKAIHIVDKYVYVCDFSDCIAVYETSGEFVTSFGHDGLHVLCITSCADGFIHVCDYSIKGVQIF